MAIPLQPRRLGPQRAVGNTNQDREMRRDTDKGGRNRILPVPLMPDGGRNRILPMPPMGGMASQVMPPTVGMASQVMPPVGNTTPPMGGMASQVMPPVGNTTPPMGGAFKRGGSVSKSAASTRRGDGVAQRGKTKGRMV